VSGSILDRIDIQIEVPALTSAELLRSSLGEASIAVRERVLAARQRQAVRGWLNATLPNAALREHSAMDAGSRRLIAEAVDRSGMSARAVHRGLRVARTIADLSGAKRVDARALGEALQYRAYESRQHLPQ
jgi:magnesium chelatase family protein